MEDNIERVVKKSTRLSLLKTRSNASSCEHSNEPLGSMKAENFFTSFYKLFKEVTVPWRW